MNGSGAIGVSASDCRDLAISGCIIQFNSFTAIYLYQVDGIAITHNRIFDNAATIEAYDSTDMQLVGNAISNNAPYN
jgi:parallel beta-helix repeat protein